MITPEKLYNCTDNGLSILELHYPHIREYADNKKPFKAREGERTPSAYVKEFKTKAGVTVWKITDFGDDGRAIDPIALHMRECNFTFPEAIQDLAQKFNITDELTKAVNRPDIRKKPATAEQKDGETYWEIDQDFSKKECEIMGPLVTPETLKSLNWYRVNYLVSVKNREATYKYSNENYPIFMRECWFTDENGKRDRFYKIYEPLNFEKQWRFQYQPKGKKPKDYINGLDELETAWREFNDQEEALFLKDPANDGKPYKEQKLPEVFICSGERDALCVRSLGFYPIWFNSETYDLSEAQFKKISRFAEIVYNIPDIDETGIRKGKELALKFIDIYTVWLPEELKKFKDHRGYPRKDLRDWMGLKGKESRAKFKILKNIANCAKFWTIKTNSKTGEIKTSIDIECLYEFLRLNGFCSIIDSKTKVSQLVRVVNNTVERKSATEVRSFVREWVYSYGCPKQVRILALSTPLLTDTSLESLPAREFDFIATSPKSQLFFFDNGVFEVNAKEILKIDGVKKGCYVWEEKCLNHSCTLLPDLFKIECKGDYLKSEDYDISIFDTSSKFFCYLINSSRIYWRNELEDGIRDLPPEEAENYLRDNKFSIDGSRLTEDQIKEQKQCLINKIFTIGYFMHQYKDPARAWAAYCMDNVIGENHQCNGRSGKSFLITGLSKFAKMSRISGRNPKVLENQFVFERVDKYTDLLLVDDCDEYLPIKDFYDSMTSGMIINPKQLKSYELDFDESPKFAFTTNYVPKEFDPSSRQRMLYVVFSDYYHQQTEENDYLQTRQIKDDFNKSLFTKDYTDAEWNADANFIMQCVKFYLSVSHLPVKIEPKLDNIIYRKNKSNVSENFMEWAGYYFAENGENVNKEIVRESAFEAFKRFSGVSKITMQKFTRSLKAYCAITDYIEEYNPEELHNSGGRILRKMENPATKAKEVKEMIYIKTKGVPVGNTTPEDDESLKGKSMAELFPDMPIFNP